MNLDITRGIITFNKGHLVRKRGDTDSQPVRLKGARIYGRSSCSTRPDQSLRPLPPMSTEMLAAVEQFLCKKALFPKSASGDLVGIFKCNGITKTKNDNKEEEEELVLSGSNINRLVHTTKPVGLGASKIRLGLEYRDKTIEEFETINMLGVGSFGKVELVQDKNHPDRVFALKVLAKENIVLRAQQAHVMNEKRILIASNSPFIIQLYKTFKDDRYVYLLMEVCLGGELWTILRDHIRFDDKTTRFFAGCVIEALDYLHHRGIAYRDLKPENLMMDSTGYVKLIDFGFATKVYPGSKASTFCGTPEYAAPEVLLGKGHDCAVDCWGLGVFIYEMMHGDPPFTGETTLECYELVLQGFSEFEFSQYITEEAKAIIKKLARDEPKARLGYKKNGISDIRRHKWFKGFNWDLFQRRAMQAPFRPKIKSMIDTSNFDAVEVTDEIAVEEFSGWDEHF